MQWRYAVPPENVARLYDDEDRQVGEWHHADGSLLLNVAQVPTQPLARAVLEAIWREGRAHPERYTEIAAELQALADEGN